MTISITLPGSGEPRNVKDAIILILSQESTLNLKAIHSKVRGDKKLNVSYQAVHKAIRLLEKEGIVRKDRLSYSISREWVNQLKQFVEKLELVKG